MRKVLLACIAVVALTLRLANAFLLPWQGGDLVISDMKGYDRSAQALLEQKPLGVHTAEHYLFHPLGSDTYHPPGYYYFLATVYALSGYSYLAVRVAQAFLGTLTCMLVYLLGKAVFGNSAGLLAAAFTALYPPLIFYTGVLLTETLSTFLLAATVWLLLTSTNRAPRQRTVSLVIAGFSLGFAALTRSVLLVTVPIALLWMWIVGGGWPGWQQALRSALAFCLPIALVIAPVTIRNYQIHQQFILISTNGGVNFFLGHGGSTAWKNQIRGIPPDYEEGDPLIGISSRTATEEEAYFYQLGWEYIRQHPLRTILDLPDKFRRMYWASDYWPASDAQAHLMRTLDQVLWKLLLVPLWLLSFLCLRGQSARRAALLYGLVIASAVIPLVFWAQTRFRVPFVPLVIVVAAGALSKLCTRLTNLGIISAAAGPA
jgi:4-amino-4-deoxy-L-arabinose transferase-like glycosyltransferase